MYITLNSQFKPFTYDELVKPLQDYGEAYKEVENEFSTLAQQTEAWKNIATQENNPEAYAMYKKYSDELNSVVEDFSKGMTLQNRGKLMGLKSRYFSEIKPISDAHNAIKDAEKHRDALRSKHGNIVFLDNNLSIDKYLHGENVDNRYIDLNEEEKIAADRTSAMAYTKYNELVSSTNLTPEEAVQHIILDPSLKNAILQDSLASRGLEGDSETAQAIVNSIANGINTGLGKFASTEYMTAAQRASLAQQEATFNEGIRRFNLELQTQGYDKKGNIIKDSPYWELKGIKWEETKNGLKPTIIEDTTSTKPVDIYINTEGVSYNTKSGEVVSTGNDVDLSGYTLLSKYDDLTAEEKAQADKHISDKGGTTDMYSYYVYRKGKQKDNKVYIKAKSKKTMNNDQGDNDL